MEKDSNPGSSEQSTKEDVQTENVIANPLTSSQIELNEDPAQEQDKIAKSKTPIATRIKGITLMIVTSVFATTQGSIVKYDKDVPTGMIILIVAVYTFCFFCVLVAHVGVSVTDFPKKKWVAMRVGIGSVAYVCKVWSFQFLPLGDASALVFTSPIFTCVIARIFLKEKLTPVSVGSLIFGLGGVVLIAKPTFIFGSEGHEFPWYYTIVPLLSALTLAITYVLQRKIAADVSSITISFYVAVAQLFAGLGYQVLSGDPYTTPVCYVERELLVICGLCLLIVWVSANLALRYESATLGSIIRNLDTVLAFFVQVVMFGERAEPMSLVGAALIMGGTISLALSKIFNITCGIKL